jgi:flagellar protein FliS
MEKSTSEYLVQEVECAEPVRLIEMLYQRALRDLECAREMWPDKARRGEAMRFAVHAQMIIGELFSALNVKEGGDIAVNLMRLYEFMQYHLVQAVNSPDPEAIRKLSEIIGLLQPISDAWSTITRDQLRSQTNSLAEGGSLVA